MPPLIRPASAVDRKEIVALLALTAEFAPVDFTVACELLDAYLEDVSGSGYPTLVIEDGGEIAGYVCYGPTPLTEGVWDIYWIAVAPRSRGKGYGRKLIVTVEQKISQAGGRMVLIETSSTEPYEPARKLYLALGYTLEAVVRDFYKTGDDKLIYRKTLA
jgi:ribosomal protein S18 acetylase RimI-like enzyme